MIEKVTGSSIGDSDDNWYCHCPKCDKYYEYTGYYDSEDITNCKCGCNFRTIRVYFDEGRSYMGEKE